MKTFFAVLAIFICPTFAFGDTIGPSTGCANSAYVGDTYKLNLNCSGDQLAGDSILGVADVSDRTANSISRQKDQLHSTASNSKILITGMRLRYADGGVLELSGSAGKGKSFGYSLGGEPFDSAAHEWSGSAGNGKSFGYPLGGEPFDSAAHVWKPLLTKYESSSSADEDESDLLARNMTDDFFHHAGSFVRPTSFNDRKDDGDHDRNKDDNGKNESGKNGKDGDDDHRAKDGGYNGEKGGGDDGQKGGGDEGGKGGDDGGGTGGYDGGNGGGDDGHTRKIPEPSSLIMLGTGLLIGGAMLRKFVA